MSLFQGTGHRLGGGDEQESEQAPDQQELYPAVVVESQSFEEAPEEDGLEVAPEAASVGSSAATSIGHPKDKDEWIGWLMNATDVLQDIGVCSSALVQKLTHQPLEKLMMWPDHQESQGEKINLWETVAKVLV